MLAHLEGGLISEYIINFLYQKELTAIDVIIISVIGSSIFLILSSFFVSIGKIFKNKVLKPRWPFLKRTIRLIVKRKMTVGEYFRANERLELGGSLKWYEKTPFYNMKKEKERTRPRDKEIVDLINKETSEYRNKFDNYTK